MRIHIATDHAGLEFSTQLQHHLAAEGHEVVDHGPIDYDPLDDYPAFCVRAAQGVVADQAAGVPALGVVFGGSGNGEQIAANKVEGARAALVWNQSTAQLAREHNDANVIAIGARQHEFDEVVALIDGNSGERLKQLGDLSLGDIVRLPDDKRAFESSQAGGDED